MYPLFALEFQCADSQFCLADKAWQVKTFCLEAEYGPDHGAIHQHEATCSLGQIDHLADEPFKSFGCIHSPSALIGIGAHGKNGIDLPVNQFLIQTGNNFGGSCRSASITAT